MKKKKVLDAKSVSEMKNNNKKLRNSTILMGALVIGAIAIWSVVANRWVDIPGIGGLTDYQQKSPVVATVDGKPIYLSEVKTVAQQMPQLAELPFDMIYPKLLNEMINARVLQQAALDSDLEGDSFVQQRLKAVHDQILAQSYLLKQLATLATEEELKKVYIEEIKNFRRPEEIHARHILVKTSKEARDILIQLKAGADFKMLANTKSLDAENNNGGDLGYFQKDMMIPEFSEPVFTMKKGQISEPIKTPFGWHIVLVEDRRLANPPAFEDVKEQLRQVVYEKNKDAVIEQERLRYNVDVRVKSLDAKDTQLQNPENAVADVEESSKSGSSDSEKVVDDSKTSVNGVEKTSELVPQEKTIPVTD